MGPLERLDGPAIARLTASTSPRWASGALPPDSRAALADARGALFGRVGGGWRSAFVAAVERLSAADAVALASRGCCGFVVGRDPSPHARAVCLALGLPAVVCAPWPPLGLGELVELDATGPEATLRAAAGAPSPPGVPPRRPARLHVPGAIPVLPAHLLDPPLAASGARLELVCGQADERAVAHEVAHGGVGLLRLEYVLFADPAMDHLTLTEALTAILADFPGQPVGVRLTDFRPDKPPLDATPLQAWDGRPGLAGVADTGAMDLQLQALAEAARLAGHRDVTAIAPGAEPGEAMARLVARARDLGLGVGAMVETARGLRGLDALVDEVDGVWIGCRDLADAVGEGQVADAAARVAEAAGAAGKVCLSCGGLGHGQLRAMNGLLAR